MKNTISLITLSTSLLFVGCAGIQKVPLSKEHAQRLQQASLSHTEREFPSIFVYSTGDATAGILGGAVGGAIAGATGDKSINERIKDSGAPNPNDLFREKIFELLESHFSITDLSTEGIVLEEKNLKLDLKGSSVETDFILDSSVGWMCSYLPMNWKRYMFQFHFFLTITDPKSTEVIYSDHFHWKTPKEMGFPKMSEFLTDEYTGVEAQIRAACLAAAQYFDSQLKTK